jgi:hypothetical protein
MARLAKWQLPRTVAAVVFEESGRDRYHAPTLPHDVLMDPSRPQPCLVVPDPDGPGRRKMLDSALEGCVTVVGPTVGLTEVVASVQRAREGLALARRGILNSAKAIHWVEHMSELVVFEDEDLVRRLAEVRLAPFVDLRPAQQDRLAETLLAWLQIGWGGAAEVATHIHVHPQTVRYRMRKLETLFGDQLHAPDVRFELEIALRARQLLTHARERDLTVDGPGDVIALPETRSRR